MFMSYNYQNFIKMNRRKFLNYIGCGCCGVIVNGCSTAPITDRKQLKIIPENKLNAQAAEIYKKIKVKEKMSDDKKTLNDIKEIGKRMEDSISEYFSKSGIDDPTVGFDWEYILIDDKKVKNAWCMPGGKIAVYTGILDVTKNKDGLAAVMGHEIAHAVAKHSVERASRSVLLNTGTQLIDIFSGGKLSQVNRVTGMNTVGLLSQIGLMNPFSRTQESEADYLGMIFSSLSGYDIRETKKLWERMKASKKGKEISEFMSTHPSSDTRIKNLREWETQIIIDYPPITIG
jgi:predicted Zn-dependent protease